jgi:hypothetical protein
MRLSRLGPPKANPSTPIAGARNLEGKGRTADPLTFALLDMESILRLASPNTRGEQSSLTWQLTKEPGLS